MNSMLIVNGQRLDLAEEIAVPFSFSVADIKNPDKRKRNSSKNITLPGTVNNMLFFSSAYRLSLTEIESGGIIGFDFDPTIRIEAQYYKQGKKIFDGLIQLLNVTYKNKVPSLNILLSSNYIDLFQALGDIKVSELGWSEYDHELNITNIALSWDTSVTVNGSDVNNFTGAVPDGFGYLYPLADYGYSSNLRDYLTNNIFPHVYVKEVMEKAFAVAGLTIDSDFMSTERFKRLVFGYGGGSKITISPAEVTARRINYNGTGTYATEIHHTVANYIGDPLFGGPYWQYYYNFNQRLKWGDNFWMSVSLVNDDLTQMDQPGEAITIARSGNYNMTFTGDFDITQNIVGSVIPGGMINMYFKASVYRNGAQIGTYKLQQTSSSTTVNVEKTLNFNFTAGDIIHTEIQAYLVGLATLRSTDPPSSAPYIEYELTNNGTWNQDVTSVQAPVVDGDTIHVANFLPEMTASDFVRGIVTMFNLYTSDPDVDNICKVEPLQDFYFDTNVFDNWTDKVDYDRDIIIKPASTIEGKVYKYKWAEQDDYYNKIYREEHGIGYGNYDYQVPSTFLKGDRVFELPFGQTVPVQVPGCNIIIPTIITIDTSTNAVSPYKGKGRIYIYNGLRSSDSWVLRNSQDLVTTVTYNAYPCLNHLDDIDNPTFDLNWGIPTEVFWTATAYTMINLFSEYYEQFVRETTGKDSKILIAYVKLNEDDVQPEKMRRLANIGGVLYRKNEIKDFNGNGEETVQTELVRIITANKRRSLTTFVRPAIMTIGGDILLGGNDNNGADTKPAIMMGSRDKVEVTAKRIYGG